MCQSSEHRVEVLPDGQVAEEHVLTDGQMAALQARISLLIDDMERAAYNNSYPRNYYFEEVPDGQ